MGWGPVVLQLFVARPPPSVFDLFQRGSGGGRRWRWRLSEVLEENPHLRDVTVPVGCTLAATVVAWVVIPLILKSCYNVSIEGTKDTQWGPFPYEASYWAALEDPLQYLISFFALSLAGYLIAPLIVSNYVLPAWKAVMMASFVWFLQRWKRSAFAQAFTVMEINEVDRINLTNLDTLLSNGIFGLGLLALAAAVEVSMQYIIWISLAGKWVVVMAGRDTMRNVLYGYCLQVGVGDMVKTRSGTKGQVVEIGVTTILVLVENKLPVVLPNSELYFKARVWRSANSCQAMVAKISLRTYDLNKIHLISKDLKSMLLSKSKVILEVGSPYCFLSRIGRTNAELVMGCCLECMSAEELVSTEQDIIHESGKIINLHDATNSKKMTIRYFRNKHYCCGRDY